MRDTWRKNWLRSIRELSALDWQSSLWGESNNPHHSYVEYIESYIDDLALAEGYASPLSQGFVSNDEVEAVANLHKTVKRYHEPSSPYDHSSILADPLWINLTKIAEATRQSLLSLLIDREEIEILKRTEPEYP